MSDDPPRRIPFRPGPPLRGIPGGPGRPRTAESAGGTPPVRALLLLVVTLLAVVLLAPVAARRYTDWLWFRELGFERVFLLRIVAQWSLGLAVGIGGLAVLLANVLAARRRLPPDDAPDFELRRAGAPGPQAGEALLMRLASTAALPVSLLFAFFMAMLAASEWRTVVQWWHRVPFGVVDPVFGRDVAWYVFTLPVIESALGYLSLVLVLALVIVVPLYAARGDVGLRGAGPRLPGVYGPGTYGASVRPPGIQVSPLAAVHLGVLVALLLVVAGIRMLVVDVPGLLYSESGPLQGAGYTDLHVRLPMLRVTGALAILAGGLVLRYARQRRFGRGVAIVVASYFGASVLLLGLVPAAFQRLVVQPNELARETPQLRNHIAATRAAWGLDSVERRELGLEQSLTRDVLTANRATIDNVRLWDRDPLLQTFGQIQAIRTYYDFIAVDDDRYRIGGELRQVMLSARELNTRALPTRTFINEHLTFTHGMGITLGPSNQVTAEGLPVLWVKDLPPASNVEVQVRRPQIYFGELSNDFVLAPTRQREFDYPAGEGDAAAVYSRYAGQAGVPAGSLVRRALFALRFGSLNVLLSSDLLPESRVLFHRNVRERAELALPFVRFDRDPYLVVTDSGTLVWVLDAYTTTDRYPYAQRLDDGTSYMRNSVKVTIDAYHGTLRAYVADPADPMIRTLAGIYPGLLRPLAEMPADVRAHLRYPEDLFRAQTALYATFHMTDPETFYHREDQWQVPAGAARQGRQDRDQGFMRHMVMRLPGEPEPEFILMRPFTPRQKDNLAAWMVARNDGENYGKLVAYRFPRQSLVFGPTQIVNRINQDTEVSRQVSLWDQRGSEVIRGELLVIPIGGSLIYVQPLYLRAEGGRIPELKRVIVAHESRVAMEETLEAGLVRLFGGEGDVPAATVVAAAPTDTAAAGTPGAAPVTAPSGASAAVPSREAAGIEALARQARQHYDRARAAQRADDWATYGEEMRRLGDVLDRLNRARNP